MIKNLIQNLSIPAVFIFIITLQISILPAYGQASDGGMTGGGGGLTTEIDDYRVLNDFLYFDSDYREEKSINYLGVNYTPLIWNTAEAPQTQWLKSDPYKLYNIILEEWQSLPFSNSYMYINLAIGGAVAWFLSAREIEGHDEHTAYYKKIYRKNKRQYDYEIFISRPKWNATRILSQVGLIAHESLRHVQFGLASGSNKLFNESALQIATSIFVLCKPRPMLSTYIWLMLSGKETEFFKINDEIQNFQQLMNNYCEKRY